MTTTIYTFRASTKPPGTFEMQAPDHATAWTTARAVARAMGAEVLNVEQVQRWNPTHAPPRRADQAPRRVDSTPRTPDDGPLIASILALEFLE